MNRPPINAKFKLGDEVLVIDYHRNETVAHARILGWRGGGVAPYYIEITENIGGRHPVGSRQYMSGRDMKLLNRPESPVRSRYLSTEEKLDLLLEHLGLRIEVEPQVVKVVDDEKASN